jgi:pimeloyl-ACP methyl ester carboxylesterase
MFITTRQLSENLHKVSGVLLRSAGFKLHRWGPDALKIGMWRKQLRSRRHKNRQKGPLVLIPGFADSPLSWLPALTLLQTDLARRFEELVLIEFPGYHGYLYNERSFDSIDAMVEALLPALDSVNPHTIIGHSLGGGLAAHYAAKRGSGYSLPTQLEQVLLISPSGVFVDLEFRTKIETRILQIVENGLECLRDLRPSLLENEGCLSRVLTELLKFGSQDEIKQFIRSFRDDHCLDPLLPLVRARVDLIWGTNDTLIPPTVIPCWLSGLTQTQTRVAYLEGVGHAPQLEAPARLSSTISRLIKTQTAEKPVPGFETPSSDQTFSAEIFSLLR